MTTALEDGIPSYDFEIGNVLDFDEKVVSSDKLAPGASAISTSVYLPAVTTVYQDGI